MTLNRQQAITVAAVAGAIFLLFFWTHLIFRSSMNSADASVKTLETKIDKALALSIKIKKGGAKGATSMNTGLLSFLQTAAEDSGLADRIGSIKPKTVPGAAEAATIRLESMNYNETITFLQAVEKYKNLSSSNVKISKRFDNEKLLNLVMDIIKK